ncbi:MAG: hypothetical protein R2718_13090 [Solirubrobacterales bacterium]|nr:hypothetical protein [Solirubrobacterales bacterium]
MIATPDVAAAALADCGPPWEEALDAVVDSFAAMLRDAPAMRSLWIAGAMDPATGRIAAGADDVIAERLRERLTTLAGTGGHGSPADWRFLVTLVGDLLHRAFRREPAGDEDTLRRGKLVARLYARELL